MHLVLGSASSAILFMHDFKNLRHSSLVLIIAHAMVTFTLASIGDDKYLSVSLYHAVSKSLSESLLLELSDPEEVSASVLGSILW